jgi:hypothetical protein
MIHTDMIHMDTMIMGILQLLTGLIQEVMGLMHRPMHMTRTLHHMILIPHMGLMTIMDTRIIILMVPLHMINIISMSICMMDMIMRRISDRSLSISSIALALL